MEVGTVTKRSKIVSVYKPDGELVATYYGFSNAARATGVKVQNIYKACRGYKTLLNGYYFKLESN